MPANNPGLILASASPRRLELLRQINIVPDEIRPSNIDETPHPGELPVTLALRLAVEKAASAPLNDGEIILAADTVVAVGRRILGKPRDQNQARAFLNLLSGRRHRVITGIAIRKNEGSWQRSVETSVRFKGLSDEELTDYLATGEWQGKAGGYAIQGCAGALVPWISGSYSNVVGLPLTETLNLLKTAGYTSKDIAA